MKQFDRRTARRTVSRILVVVGMMITIGALYAGGGRETAETAPVTQDGPAEEPAGNPPLDVDYITEEHALRDGLAVATLAGGCFWCMEPPYDKLDGVISTTSGYAGGHVVNPRYEEVVTGTTGHTEVVQIVYDPQRVTYETLLDVFWVSIDPVDAGGQFCDRGPQYRSEIFYHTPQQREAALASRQALEQSGVLPRAVVTEVTALETFYPAEEYHQDYYLKNPLRYVFYRTSCGRDARLRQLWGDDAPSPR